MKKSFQKPRITSVQYVRRRKSLNESVQQNPMELIEYPLDRAKSSADSNKFHVERIRKDSFDREMERSQLQRTNTFQSEEGSQRLSSSKSRKQINLRFPSAKSIRQGNTDQRPKTKRGQIRDINEVKKEKRQKKLCRPGYICCIVTGLLLLLAALIATLLALLLKNPSKSNESTTTGQPSAVVISTTNMNTSTPTTASTTSTTSTTTSTLGCTSSGRGVLLALNDSTPSIWTSYQINYTATNTLHTLSFGFQNENNREYLLDQVSVININNPSVELLSNGNFENSTTNVTNWNQLCTGFCGGFPGILSTVNCYNSSNCFRDQCRQSSGIDFLQQSFSTIIGQTYTISFMLILSGSGTTASNRFYFDIY